MDAKMTWQPSLLLTELIFVGDLSNELNYHCCWNENWKLAHSNNSEVGTLSDQSTLMKNAHIYKPMYNQMDYKRQGFNYHHCCCMK